MTQTQGSNNGQEDLANALIDIAAESWRFGQTVERLLQKLDVGEKKRQLGQLEWFRKKVAMALTALDLRIVNVEGDSFDPGMAATPVNIKEFKESDILVVDRMLEPIMMGPHGLVRTGTVILRKAN